MRSDSAPEDWLQKKEIDFSIIGACMNEVSAKPWWQKNALKLPFQILSTDVKSVKSAHNLKIQWETDFFPQLHQ